MLQFRCPLLTLVRHYSSVNTTVISKIFKKKPVNERLQLKGWVKALRRHKEFTFIDVNDGSCSRSLQVVLPSEKRPESLGYHSSLFTSGVLRTCSHKGQDIELLAEEIQVIGENNLENYPFKARTKSTPDYVRQHLHLRGRTNFSSLLRVRSQAKMAIHNYFTSEDFINIDTPLLTGNDCEGAGEVFFVETPTSNKENSESSPHAKFFNHPVYLTVSGQLHLEAMVSGLSRVYNFNPAFRAENSQSRRHLSEFWMVEAEEGFLKGSSGFQSLTERVESLIKYTTQYVLDRQEEDIFYCWKQNQDTEKVVRASLQKQFGLLPYSEAIEILKANSHNFKRQPVQGEDLGREHELYLTKHMGNIPVFVIDWPKKIKAFYMCPQEEDPNLVYGLDLLFPNVGEVVGGGLREHNFLALQNRLQEHNLKESLNWYLDLRRFNGRISSGGFGLGFERYLLFLLGTANIKDVIPFPRWSKHCLC
ncbi:asparaginyl-tRNA synthetase-like [Macrobrachium nipponense]|uniref:asparaginyl-tRNA synthetase-like n=1 Tax=Macrobrachium nipponense TaxID=159736 RepID=UPI0030C8797F